MNKQILIVGITVTLLLVTGLSGCIETINTSGIETKQTINKPGKEIRLAVSGVDCDITVTKETDLVHIDLSGVGNIVRVSRSHSFSSDISGIDCEIVYYD